MNSKPIMYALRAIRTIAECSAMGRKPVTHIDDDVRELRKTYDDVMQMAQTVRSLEAVRDTNPLLEKYGALYRSLIDPLPIRNTAFTQQQTAQQRLDLFADAGEHILEFLGIYGAVSDDYRAQPPKPLCERDPEITKDIKGHGTAQSPVERIWKETARSFRNRGIPMDDWAPLFHERLFSKRIHGSSVQFAQLLYEKPNVDRSCIGFYVAEKNVVKDPRTLTIKNVGIVSSSMCKENVAMGIAMMLLERIIQERQQILPEDCHEMKIVLDLPKKTAGSHGIVDGVVI